MSSESTIEPLLNGELARLLREQGFDAAAEQSVRDIQGNRHQVDVLIDLDDQAIAIEAEFDPGSTVIQDAKKRLPLSPLRWRSLEIQSVFALQYPHELKQTREDRARELLPEAPLRFQEVSCPTPGSFDIGQEHQGNVRTLAETLQSFWFQQHRASAVDEIVNEASQAITLAAECLERNLPKDDDQETPAALALVWLNALLFQELLSINLAEDALPLEHRDKRIHSIRPNSSPDEILDEWNRILEINWWPIFAVARDTLSDTPSRTAKLALDPLISTARSIAARGEIRRHDIAGRIYHRLLNSRKFLATNYTTIPAAVLLASLAFDPEHPRWNELDWSDLDAVSQLKVCDPSCGTGTLLMAALQEMLRSFRQSTERADTAPFAKKLLENVLWGYDVVPGAVHLTAATLSMAETRQVTEEIPIQLMGHDVHEGMARLGSLDFLRSSPSQGRAQGIPLFPEHGGASRTTSTGEEKVITHMPEVCDLIIANPPYTRAGGPGDRENTDWNPLFGSIHSKDDVAKMKRALTKALQETPASMYAGLGSAFLALADERLRTGGRLAFVLPATLVTGSRWETLRQLLLNNYDLEWVIACHDFRHRSKTSAMPGRLFVSFSESTRIAEVLIIATKRIAGSKARGITRFVNLRHNMNDPLSAMAVARSLLAVKHSEVPTELLTGETFWGEITPVAQSTLTSAPWVYAAFVQYRLAETAAELINHNKVGECAIPLAPLESLVTLGPPEMNIKNKKQGLFTIAETSDPSRMGAPALWHHKATKIKTLRTLANARLYCRKDRDKQAQNEMLKQAGRLQFPRELRHAPQRLAAVLTNEPMLGVRSWITLKPYDQRPGVEEALCLWLNSTLGFLLRLAHANRPYLGRTGLPHEKARTLPVLDIRTLSEDQLGRAIELFASLKNEELQGFAHIAEDSVRRELDARFATEVLNTVPPEVLHDIAKRLNREPTTTARH